MESWGPNIHSFTPLYYSLVIISLEGGPMPAVGAGPTNDPLLHARLRYVEICSKPPTSISCLPGGDTYQRDARGRIGGCEYSESDITEETGTDD